MAQVMFGLLLFNAVILERRKFGALGWNIQYQFTDGDCDVCLRQAPRSPLSYSPRCIAARYAPSSSPVPLSFAMSLGGSLRQAEMLVHEYETVPYKVISALTADINYGGRVTDDWDRRTISNLLGAFVNADVLRTGYCFSPSGNYRSVDAADKDSYLEYIASLPTNANPEVFGLHENADITCAQARRSPLTARHALHRAACTHPACLAHLTSRVPGAERHDCDVQHHPRPPAARRLRGRQEPRRDARRDRARHRRQGARPRATARHRALALFGNSRVWHRCRMSSRSRRSLTRTRRSTRSR